jgi:hypothetical protein
LDTPAIRCGSSGGGTGIGAGHQHMHLAAALQRGRHGVEGAALDRVVVVFGDYQGFAGLLVLPP